MNTTTPKKCQKCGCEMTVECDGRPMHVGRNWPRDDYSFCLERLRDKSSTTIYELRGMVEYLAAMGDQLARELNKLGGSKELTDAYEDQSGLIKKNLVRLLGKDE